MPTLPMAPQVFSILSALIAERAGLHFDASHAPIFGDKVAARAVEVGFDSLLEYYYYLRYDAGGGPELDLLIEQLVVGETYLFRELAPLEVAVARFVAAGDRQGTARAHLVRRLRHRRGAAHRGHAAGRARVAERGRADRQRHQQRRARDARARGGSGAGRCAATSRPFAARWVHADADGVSVESRLTDAIQWRRINLVEGAPLARPGHRST